MNEVLRQERRYLLTAIDAQRLGAHLGSMMIEDEHSGPEGYPIRSLYFDGLQDDRGRRIRLRVYGPEADLVMLEMKQKAGPYQRKCSLRLEREDARRLCQGDRSPLLAYSGPFAAECYELLRECCRPKVMVECRRRAFTSRESRIRITLDSQIVATEAHWDMFSPVPVQRPVMDPFHVVLEIKYDGSLFSCVRDLAEDVDRSQASRSECCPAWS